MENFSLPDRNIFDEKSKEFTRSSLGKRLASKYKPKPYEEKRRGLYLVAWIGSFFCNMVAVVTGSTFLFGYALGLTKSLPGSVALAVSITAIILVGIEALKQLLVPDFFQDYNQFKKVNYLQGIAIVGLMCISTVFNWLGGFDVTTQLSTPPPYIEPTLKGSDQVRADYQPRIKQAEQEAEQYRSSKLWDGRLSDDNAKEYSDLLDSKRKLEKVMLSKLDSVEAYNDRVTAKAQQEHKEQVEQHELKTAMRGRGLAWFSLVCELGFLFCCWYREHYEYKTAKQYATIEETEPLSPTPPENKNDQEKNQRREVKHTKATPINGSGFKPGNHNGSSGLNQTRSPIGFKTQTQRELEQAFEAEDTDTSEKEIVFTTRYADTYTVEHNGKRYRLVDVNRFIRTYKDRHRQAVKRVQEAKTQTQKTKRKETEQGRLGQWEYWKGKRAELLSKVKET